MKTSSILFITCTFAKMARNRSIWVKRGHISHPLSSNSHSFLPMTPTHPTPHNIISFLPSPSPASLSSHSISSMLP
ncbi:hypothetical protein HAZT_HAZT001352, partial [Hyalella azteca]